MKATESKHSTMQQPQYAASIRITRQLKKEENVTHNMEKN